MTMVERAFFTIVLCVWLAALAWLSVNEPDRLLVFGRIFVAVVHGMIRMVAPL